MNDEDKLRYSARGLRSCAVPPEGGRPTRVRDVLLVTIAHVDGDASLGEEFGAHPPVESAELGRGLILGTLEAGEIKLIQVACSRRGHFFYPHGSDGVRYAFWRDVTDQALSANGLVAAGWDEDQTIFTAVALSRWVRDNAAGTELAARLVDYDTGGFQVRPQELFESSHSYRLALIERDWLDTGDATVLRSLLDAYWQRRDDLPERVSRAIWRAELASWSRWLDQTLPLVVGAFEALFATRIRDLTVNFKRRVPLLADMVGVDGVDSDFAERIYAARSEGVHGSPVGMFAQWNAATTADVRLAIALLRRALRTLVEREDFAEHFADKPSIDRLFGRQAAPRFPI